jgi:uncharacterized protein YjbI with pentapeptide repeats
MSRVKALKRRPVMEQELVTRLEETTRQIQAVDADLSGSTFTNVNLANARFENVTLGTAIIHNANLTGLRISNADLRGASIVQSTMKGMTIDGVDVADLFAAWKSAHPEAARP